MDSSDPELVPTPDHEPLAMILAAPRAVSGPPRVWTVFVAFAVVLVAVIAGGVGQAIMLIATGDLTPGRDLTQQLAEFLKTPIGLLTFAPASIATGSAALIGAALSPSPWRLRLRLGRPAHVIILSLAGIVGMIALGHALECAITVLRIERRGTLQIFAEVFASFSGWRLALAILVIGVLAGTCEELLFRGYIQTRLEARCGGAVAIAITAVLFGVMHLDPLHSPLAAILGLFLGYLTLRAQSIWPAMAAHIVNNSASTVFSAWDVDVPGGGRWLVGSLLVVAMCIGVIHRFSAEQRPTQ